MAAFFLRGDLETGKNSRCKIKKSRTGKTRNSQLATHNFCVGVAARAARFLFGFRLETSRVYSARAAGGFDLDGAVCLRIRAEIAECEKSLYRRRAFATFLIVALLAQFFVHDFVHTETVKHLVETAAANGYKSEKIVNMHTISHSVEFYGAGRLVREADGKQVRFYGVKEVVEEMDKENAESDFGSDSVRIFGQSDQKQSSNNSGFRRQRRTRHCTREKEKFSSQPLV